MFGFFKRKAAKSTQSECDHDWIRFREPKEDTVQTNSKYAAPGIPYSYGWYWVYKGTIVARKSRQGYGVHIPGDEVCDLTCSFCNHMDLRMQRAIKNIRQNTIFAYEYALEMRLKKEQKEKEDKIRRAAAREFARNYVQMKDKAGSS